MKEKQTNRWIRAYCAQCKYIIRVSRFLLLKYGAPYCPKCYKAMKHPPISCTAAYVRHDYHAPDDMVDALAQEKIAAQKGQMEAIRRQDALERQVRERVYAEAERKRQEESAAEWEKWKADPRNGYPQPVFVDPYAEDLKRAQAHDAEMQKIMADIERSKREAHEAYERAEEERWQRLKARIEAMAPAEPAPAQPEPERRKKYGRAWIHSKWEENQDALTALRKPRVQERLIKDARGTENDDPGEIGLKQAQESRQDSITEAAEDAVDVSQPGKVEIVEDGE